MNINATLIGELIAFLVFVIACMKWVWPPIIGAIETRQQKIADGLAASDRAEQDRGDEQQDGLDVRPEEPACEPGEHATEDRRPEHLAGHRGPAEEPDRERHDEPGRGGGEPLGSPRRRRIAPEK